MPRNNFQLDFEDMRGTQTSVIQSSPALAVLTSPDFMKEVNFHQKIATFGTMPQSNGWTDYDLRNDDPERSLDLHLPYNSNGYLADPYWSSSTEYELPTEVEDIAMQIKKEPQQDSASDKELTDKEYEDKLKLERRRLKNREAAHRCRRKKMEKIAQLEGQVRALKNENSRIQERIKRLEEEAAYLRSLCLERENGCPRCASGH